MKVEQTLTPSSENIDFLCAMINAEIKNIEIEQYNPEWPLLFRDEAARITQILGENCIDIHHIGSTSVPGLAAKRDIDILVLVDKLSSSLCMQDIGYIFKGEYNIPMRYYFSKSLDDAKFNMHVVEADHGFIALNLCFRDYLRTHPQDSIAYAALKEQLLRDPKSYQRTASRFTEYNLGKNDFIKNTLRKAGFDRVTFNFCMHDEEYAAAKYLRQKYFFDKVQISDPYLWTFTDDTHVHLVLYKGADIIGYAHIQLWPDLRAAMRIIVIDEIFRGQKFGTQLLQFCEKWLKQNGYKSIHAESAPDALKFYTQNGYLPMSFNDPDGYARDAKDIEIGKVLYQFPN